MLEAYAGLVWAGYNLANFALLLELTPAALTDPRRWRSTRRSCSRAPSAGPLLGGWLADTFGFHVIFAASGAGRLLGILLYIWLAVWPILGARSAPPAPSRAEIA